MLPDLVRPGLAALVCGTAAGAASAARGEYYAGRGNRFWQVLHETGLTDAGRPLRPAEWRMLGDFGIGLTDLCKDSSGMDSALPPGALSPGGFMALLDEAHPHAVAFNGKAAACAVLGDGMAYGEQDALLAGARVFVLPSTSGAARGHWDIGPWQAFAVAVGAARRKLAAGRADDGPPAAPRGPGR